MKNISTPAVPMCQLPDSEVTDGPLAVLAKRAGYSSLRSLLNENRMWDCPPSEVEQFLNEQTPHPTPRAEQSHAPAFPALYWTPTDSHEAIVRLESTGREMARITLSGYLVDGRTGKPQEPTPCDYAALFAAAPELLSTLRGCLSHDDALRPEWKLPPSLRSAIAKAIARATSAP